MRYTKQQVVEMINDFSKDLNGEKIINDWMKKQSNIELDLSKNKYELFCYTFPILIDNVVQAEISLLSLYAIGDVDSFANKYLGDKFETSWDSFSHDSYLYAYLSINDELLLPKSNFSDTFYCYDGTFNDINGNTVEYKISYGDYNPDNDKEEHNARLYRDRYGYTQYFFDCGVILLIEKVKNFEGNNLGEEINKRIKDRINN